MSAKVCCEQERLKFFFLGRGVFFLSQLDVQWLTALSFAHTSTSMRPTPDWLNALLATRSSWSRFLILKRHKVWRAKHHTFLTLNPVCRPPAVTPSLFALIFLPTCAANWVSVDWGWNSAFKIPQMSLASFSHHTVRLDVFFVFLNKTSLFPFYSFGAVGRLNWINSNDEQNMRFYDAFHFNWIKIGLNSYTPAEWNKCGSNDYHGIFALSLDIKLRNNIWIKGDYCRESYIKYISQGRPCVLS